MEPEKLILKFLGSNNALDLSIQGYDFDIADCLLSLIILSIIHFHIKSIVPTQILGEMDKSLVVYELWFVGARRVTW